MFKKAQKTTTRLRMALIGPSGSGKTYTALNIAKHLGQKVALIDTEHGSASKYSDVFSFDSVELKSFSTDKYIEAIQAACKEQYDVLIIDSLSHAWVGTGGILQMVEQSQDKSKFGAWKRATPQHQSLLDAILAAPIDIIVTMRSKTAYAMEEDERGKTKPVKVGLAPVQRDGIEYEFDIIAELDQSNILRVTKSRCSALSNAEFSRAGEDIAKRIKAWLGEPPTSTFKAAAELANRVKESKTSPSAPVTEVVSATATLPVTASIAKLSSESLNRIYTHSSKAKMKTGALLEYASAVLGREIASPAEFSMISQVEADKIEERLKEYAGADTVKT